MRKETITIFGRRKKIRKVSIHCPRCGRSLKGATQEMIGDTGICPKCKAEFIIEQKQFLSGEKTSEPISQKGNPAKNKSIWSWHIDEVELKNQVENYTTLNITKSYRGILVLIISALLGLSLLLSFFGTFADPLTILLAIAIYSPIIFFVYRGHRWAVILLMALYTFERGFIYLEYGNNRWQIFWWLVVMPYFWKTLKVENERRKKGLSVSSEIPAKTVQVITQLRTSYSQNRKAGRMIKKFLSNILGALAVIIAAISTSVGSIIVFIIIIGISPLRDMSWWKLLLFGLVFFLVLDWGGYFLGMMLLAISESLKRNNNGHDINDN